MDGYPMGVVGYVGTRTTAMRPMYAVCSERVCGYRCIGMGSPYSDDIPQDKKKHT